MARSGRSWVPGANFRQLLAARRPLALCAAILLVTACSGHWHAVAAAGTAETSGMPSPAAEPGVTTYMCTSVSEDLLLQWQTDSTDLSGTYQDAELSGTAPSEQVTTNSGNLSGTLNASGGITLSIGFSQPLYGTITSGQLTLNVPQSDGTIQPDACTSASLNDWNNSVSGLQNQVASDNAAAEQQQAQQQHDQDVSTAQQSLASDVSSLESDAQTLNTDDSLATAVNQMKTDYQQEQTDYATEQSDSCDSMGGDADTVGGDADTVGGDLDSLNGAVTSLQGGDIQSVKTDLSDIQSDLSTLQGLGATPSISTSAAISTGNQALTSANSAISWANGQGSIINGAAQQLATTAQDYANSHCG
jgi:hypothetical protein